MKILFTILSLKISNDLYLSAASRLTNEILSNTNCDVLINTNNPNYFSNNFKNNSRVIIQELILYDNIIVYTNPAVDFNYNLKHLAFKYIPSHYDAVVYLDCDIKLDHWNDNSIKLITEIISNYDIGATRTECVLQHEVDNFDKALFKHKILAYKISETYQPGHKIYSAKLPSEHFLVIKNNEKLNIFQKEWEKLDKYLQSISGGHGSWGDGFEIGISAALADMSMKEVSNYEWTQVLGLVFNGNKYL